MSNDATRLPTPHPEVIHRSLPDGAVLFSTIDEVYFGLNTVASRVWELLTVSATLSELCQAMREEYPDVAPATIRADVIELLDQLQTNALVVAVPEPALHFDAHPSPVFQTAPAVARRVG